jgi:hypothetical protein
VAPFVFALFLCIWVRLLGELWREEEETWEDGEKKKTAKRG